MACPNRDNDLLILEEVARRKAQRQQEAVLMEDPAKTAFEHRWEGSLLDIQTMGIPLERVKSIVRLGDGSYLALMDAGV